ncbi:hypothetical protein RQP53_06700 [Paucibacter sp. APW11]|uniref:Uncharacterized protein n=1 Tax=Roseateles aquae TaxID=3077235 RepID=A0ABU3P8S7_9BURK|nr:hypothetical protein [Paucibacter sp. APW11]MDT8998954.1 hypothetical protein [Paucibacter sp. APW11]
MPPIGRRWLLRLLAATALLLVFFAYQQPGLMVELANQLWSCF